MEREKLEKYKKMLIVVDMLNGFIKEGVLHDEEIKRIIPRQIELIKAYLIDEELVVFIKDAHKSGSVEFRRFNNTEHCVKGTNEAEVVDELKSFEGRDNTISIEKNSTSYMEAPRFRELVSKLSNIKSVDVVGCCTDICVFNGTMGLANYYDEWNREVNITVHQDAVATFSETLREAYVDSAYLLMEQQGIKLVKKK